MSSRRPLVLGAGGLQEITTADTLLVGSLYVYGALTGAVTATGATVARLLADRAADTVSIKDFGSGPDWAPALAAAFAALPASGGTILCPPGVFPVNTAVALSNKAVRLQGAGSASTYLVVGQTSTNAITITQSSLQNVTQVSGVTFLNSASSIAPAPISIRFTQTYSTTNSNQDPTKGTVATTSFPSQTVSIDDVIVASSLTPNLPSPYAGCFSGGVLLDGAWQATVSRLTCYGPAVVPPVAGSSALEVRNCYNLQVPGISGYSLDSLVLQSAYSEFINMSAPIAVGCNFGLNITNAPWAAKGNRAGLGYYVHGGELDVILCGVSLSAANDVWVHHNHVMFTRANGGSGVTLTDCIQGIIDANVVEQGGSNTSATGVVLTGASSLFKVSNNIFRTAATVSMGSGTSGNMVTGNIVPSGLAPAYNDAGTGNYSAYETGAGLSASAPLPLASGGTGDRDTAWATYTPTVTSNAGAIGSYTATGRWKRLPGKCVAVSLSVSIATAGAGSGGGLYIGLPVVPTGAMSSGISGREVSKTGKGLAGNTSTDGTARCYVTYADGTSCCADGLAFNVTTIYESAS